MLTVLHDSFSGTIASRNVSIMTWHRCHACDFEVLDFGSLFIAAWLRVAPRKDKPLYSWISHYSKMIQRGAACTLAFTGEETLITQSFQCHLAPHPCVLGDEFNRQISDSGLTTKHVPIIGALIIVHWYGQLLLVVSSLSDLDGSADLVVLGFVCRWSSPGLRFFVRHQPAAILQDTLFGMCHQ